MPIVAAEAKAAAKMLQGDARDLKNDLDSLSRLFAGAGQLTESEVDRVTQNAIRFSRNVAQLSAVVDAETRARLDAARKIMLNDASKGYSLWRERQLAQASGSFARVGAALASISETLVKIGGAVVAAAYETAREVVSGTVGLTKWIVGAAVVGLIGYGLATSGKKSQGKS